MTVIRIVIGLIITAIVAVALVPMLVLLDLVGGGDGWGLCPDGIGSCATSYFDGPELVAALLIAIFVLLLLLRIALHAQRLVDARGNRLDAESVGRRDGLGRG